MGLHRPYRALLIVDLNNLGLTPRLFYAALSGLLRSEPRMPYVKDVLEMNTLRRLPHPGDARLEFSAQPVCGLWSVVCGLWSVICCFGESESSLFTSMTMPSRE